MKEHERSAQLWPLLILSAKNQQILSYATIRHLTGIATVKVGSCLGYLLSYCLVKKLPLLPSIVVNEATGLPGEGFMKWARRVYGDNPDMFAMQSRVFAYDWFKVKVPSPTELQSYKMPKSRRG